MFLAHGPADRPSGSSNYPLLARYRDLTETFTGIAAYNTRTFRVLAGDELVNVSGQYASGNYHAVVGAPIAIGRGFAADSDRDHGGAPAVVISDGYWTRRFGRDPSVLGQTHHRRRQPRDDRRRDGAGFHRTDVWHRGRHHVAVVVEGGEGAARS